VQRTRHALVVRAGDLDGPAVTLGDGDGLSDDEAELTLGALDRDGLAFDGDVDPGRDGDGEASDT